jgi:3-oxoacyl-[acyl-carrier protein] reductase
MSRVALVTGSSRGIGRGIALRLARDGFNLALNYVASRTEAESVAKEIRALGLDSVVLQADVSNSEQASALVRRTAEQLGRLDVVVINAGGAIRKPFQEITEDDYDRQFALARGAFFAMQEAARVIEPRGRIVVISSAATRNCPADAAVYAGAKSAMEAFARSLSRELGSRDITVNVVAPGATNTDLLKDAPAQIIESVKRNAFGRMAEVEDIADAVAMLCGPDARWITGQVVRADGGL